MKLGKSFSEKGNERSIAYYISELRWLLKDALLCLNLKSKLYPAKSEKVVDEATLYFEFRYRDTI